MLPRVPDTMMVIMYADLIGNYKNRRIKSRRGNIVGGIGHLWVKRLFIDRDFKTDSENPEENENPNDYEFVFARVEDNTALMKSEDGKAYLQMLSQLPESIREAHRNGNWDALGGNYFPEFSEAHVCKPFPVPAHWKRYRAFDYGLDMFACLWIAVDEYGRCYVYREFQQSNLIVSDAAQAAIENTGIGERIATTFAPPDMWNRQKDSGKSMAELFMVNGIGIIKANNNRVQGWLQVKDLLKPMSDGKPGLVVFDTCKTLIKNIQEIQADDTNPNDCSKEPHKITHICISGDTLICTTNGEIPIRELVGSSGKCYCWDGSGISVRPFDHVCMTQAEAEVFEVELEDGTKFKATANHKVLTAAGWKEIREITDADEVFQF